MKITLTDGTLEHLRNALDAIVEGTPEAEALSGEDWKWLMIGGDLDATAPFPKPTIKIVTGPARKDATKWENVAKWNYLLGQWERLHSCEYCGREEWTEHATWECNCRPAYATGEWSGLER